MRYRWILFDADGTLFDYPLAEEAALEKACLASGLTFEAGLIELYRRINHRIWQQLERGEIALAELKIRRFELLFEAAGFDGDAERFSARYLDGLAEGTQLIDGAEEIVRELHGRVGMVILTNGLRDVQRPRLAGSALDGRFSDVVISEEVGAAKPAPEIFDVAFERMGQPAKHEVLIVGDSLTSDIRGGSDYGIDTCWFNPGRQPRDTDALIRYEIQRLSEVVEIVSSERSPRAVRS
jgi:2-haloacid dehalogenase